MEKEDDVVDATQYVAEDMELGDATEEQQREDLTASEDIPLTQVQQLLEEDLQESFSLNRVQARIKRKRREDDNKTLAKIQKNLKKAFVLKRHKQKEQTKIKVLNQGYQMKLKQFVQQTGSPLSKHFFKRWKLRRSLQREQSNKQLLQRRDLKKKIARFKAVKCRLCSELISAEQQYKYSFVQKSQLCYAHINEQTIWLEGNQLSFCRTCCQWLPQVTVLWGICGTCSAQNKYILVKNFTSKDSLCCLCDNRKTLGSKKEGGFCLQHHLPNMDPYGSWLQTCTSCQRVLKVEFFIDAHTWCADCRQNYECFFKRQGCVKLNTKMLKKLQDESATTMEFLDICQQLGMTMYYLDFKKLNNTAKQYKQHYHWLPGEKPDKREDRFFICIKVKDVGPYTAGPFKSKTELIQGALKIIFNSASWYKMPFMRLHQSWDKTYLYRCTLFRKLIDEINAAIRKVRIVSLPARQTFFGEVEPIEPLRMSENFRPYSAMLFPEFGDYQRTKLWSKMFPEGQAQFPDLLRLAQYPGACVGCGSSVPAICFDRSSGLCFNCIMLQENEYQVYCSSPVQSLIVSNSINWRRKASVAQLLWPSKQSISIASQDVVELCRIRDVGEIILLGWDDCNVSLDKEEKYGDLRDLSLEGNKKLFQEYFNIIKDVRKGAKIQPWSPQLTPFLQHSVLYNCAMGCLKTGMKAQPKGLGVRKSSYFNTMRGDMEEKDDDGDGDEMYRVLVHYYRWQYVFHPTSFEEACKQYDRFKLLQYGFKYGGPLNYPKSNYQEELVGKVKNELELQNFITQHVCEHTTALANLANKTQKVFSMSREPPLAWKVRLVKTPIQKEKQLKTAVVEAVSKIPLYVARCNIMKRDSASGELQQVSADFDLAAGFKQYKDAALCRDCMLMEQYGFQFAKKVTISNAEQLEQTYKYREPMHISGDIAKCVYQQRQKWKEIAIKYGAIDYPLIRDYRWAPYSGNSLVQRHGNSKFVVLLDEFNNIYAVFDDQNSAFHAKDLLTLVLFNSFQSQKFNFGRMYFPTDSYDQHPLLQTLVHQDASKDNDSKMFQIVDYYRGKIEHIPELQQCDQKYAIEDKVQRIQNFFIIDVSNTIATALYGLFRDFESAIKAYDVIQIAEEGSQAQTYHPQQDYLSHPYAVQTLNYVELFQLKQQIIYFSGGNCLRSIGINQVSPNGFTSLPGQVLREKNMGLFFTRCYKQDTQGYSPHAVVDNYDNALRLLDILRLRNMGFNVVTAFPKSEYLEHELILKDYSSTAEMYEDVSAFFGGYCEPKLKLISSVRSCTMWRGHGLRGGVRNLNSDQWSQGTEHNAERGQEREGEEEDVMYEGMREVGTDAAAADFEEEIDEEQDGSEEEEEEEEEGHRQCAWKRKREEDEVVEQHRKKQLVGPANTALISRATIASFHRNKPNQNYIGVEKLANSVRYKGRFYFQDGKRVRSKTKICNTAIEAARFYDRCLILHHGFENAVTNFPKSDYEDLKNQRSAVEGVKSQKLLQHKDSVQEYKDAGGDKKKDNIPPWLSRVTPELSELMESIREMTNVQNLNKKKNGLLAPEVLLACAVIVEESAKEYTKEAGKIND